jgi:chorismate-pyruvate lyase
VPALLDRRAVTVDLEGTDPPDMRIPPGRSDETGSVPRCVRSCDSIGPVVANQLVLQAALGRTSGTVTNFLEQLVGEGIDAYASQHEPIGVQGANELQVQEGEQVLYRAATLRGHISGRSYVYAQSVIVLSRLPTRFGRRLETSIDPIGRILDEMGIDVTRQDFVEAEESVVSRLWNLDVSVGDCLLTRRYRIDSDQSPLMVITEWFLPTLTPFLALA